MKARPPLPLPPDVDGGFTAWTPSGVKRKKQRVHNRLVSVIQRLCALCFFLLFLCYLNRNSLNCIFVTTANKFSKESEKTASLAIDLGLVKRYDLINYDRFINMLKSKPKKIQQTWEKIKTLDKLDADEHYGLGFLG